MVKINFFKLIKNLFVIIGLNNKLNKACTGIKVLLVHIGFNVNQLKLIFGFNKISIYSLFAFSIKANN